MCPARSGRKDNIRRHVRNLHSESDDELRTILQKIFENFNRKKKELTETTSAKREEKTENKARPETTNEFQENTICVQLPNETDEPIVNATKVVRNIATSVIKFVGRSQIIQTCEPVETKKLKEHSQPEKSPISERNQVSSISSQPTKEMEQKQRSPKPVQTIENSTIDPIVEIGASFPSLEPLNFDPFPNLAPLPMLNTNTNLTVYRQLLSPYLKKSDNSSEHTTNNDPLREQSSRYLKTNQSMTTNNVNQPTTLIIDRPPKKMIEKYEIYRK